MVYHLLTRAVMFGVVVAFVSGCAREPIDSGPVYALLANPAAPMENSSSISGSVTLEDNCLGFKTENGDFYQFMLREAPTITGVGADAQLVLYSRPYRPGARIYGEGHELPISAARKLVDDRPPSSLCSDRVFLLNKVYDGAGAQ